MKPDQAEQNLQVIRTLMERSTIYRRALGPMMVWAGVVAIVAATVGGYRHIHGAREFIGFWVGTCAVALLGALWLARRQAVRDQEPFWSSPMRRVAQAFLPAMIAGAALTLFTWWIAADLTDNLVALWAMLYGCALHAAGMFAPRSLRYAGWLFIIGGATHLVHASLPAHVAMGAIFGGLHLACGLYLIVTETRSNAT